MPIEHTHSFGRLIIKEAFTAMKKNFIIKLSQSRAVRSACAVVCGMCFLLRLQFRQRLAANTRTRIGNTRPDRGPDGNTRTRTCAQTHKL